VIRHDPGAGDARNPTQQTRDDAVMNHRVATYPDMKHAEHPEIVALDTQAFTQLPKAGILAIDFTAAWCAPCKVMKPVLAALAAEYAGRARIVAIDVDCEPLVAQQYNVRSMPTLVILRDGREVGRIVGSRPRAFVAGVLDRALSGDVAIAAP
jgi:thioredoxin 1